MCSFVQSPQDRVGKIWSHLPDVQAETEESHALPSGFYSSSTKSQTSVPFYLVPHCPHSSLSLISFLFNMHPNAVLEVLSSVMKKGWLCYDYGNTHVISMCFGCQFSAYGHVSRVSESTIYINCVFKEKHTCSYKDSSVMRACCSCRGLKLCSKKHTTACHSNSRRPDVLF